jgi:hypothetical protein
VVDVEEINQLLWSMGTKFRAEMARPASLKPRWFPVSQSFTLAATQNFLTLPSAVNRLLARSTPEEVSQRGRRLGSPISPLTLWLFGYHFLVGREALIDAGFVRANVKGEKIAQVLDYWRRAVFAYRGDGRLDNSDAGATNPFLPPATVQTLYQALIPMDTRIQRLVPEFWKTMEEYLFLLNAEARLSITDSGPYPLNVERVLIVRDFYDLKGRYYPWRDVVADIPYHCCTLALTFNPADFQSIELTDRSELITAPSRYLDAIREIALLTSDNGALQSLPLTEMDWLVRTVKRTQPKILKWFERAAQRERIIYGALPWVQRSYSLVARMDEAVHEFDREALQLLTSYENDEARAVRWATHRCLAPGSAHVFTPLN